MEVHLAEHSQDAGMSVEMVSTPFIPNLKGRLRPAGTITSPLHKSPVIHHPSPKSKCPPAEGVCGESQGRLRGGWLLPGFGTSPKGVERDRGLKSQGELGARHRH